MLYLLKHLYVQQHLMNSAAKRRTFHPKCWKESVNEQGTGHGCRNVNSSNNTSSHTRQPGIIHGGLIRQHPQKSVELTSDQQVTTLGSKLARGSLGPGFVPWILASTSQLISFIPKRQSARTKELLKSAIALGDVVLCQHVGDHTWMWRPPQQ